ncbi:hypothetical protein LTS10_001575 [Elasticomyces elasticus]|nr:hypothetical protein LTS10_001575 [Elasticomyces elasticus]
MQNDRPAERTVWRRQPGSRTLARTTEIIPVTLPPTSVLIRVHTVSLNYMDNNIINGTNPWPVLERGIPCSDAAGKVIALGSHVSRFRVGDHISPILDRASITGDEQIRKWTGGEIEGVLASHIVVDQEQCVMIPHHLTWTEAACLPNAGVTAWSALKDLNRISAGQTVLLQGTGGVSMMAFKLALAAGCKVIITSSSDEKLQHVRQVARKGVVQTINYRTVPAWENEAISLNGGRGVDIVIENGGTSSLLQSLKAVSKGGTISQVGYLGKQDPADLAGFISLLIDKTVHLRGINVGSRQDFQEMNKLICATGLRFEDIVYQVFPVNQVQEAFDVLQSGTHVGNVVIKLI